MRLGVRLVSPRRLKEWHREAALGEDRFPHRRRVCTPAGGDGLGLGRGESAVLDVVRVLLRRAVTPEVVVEEEAVDGRVVNAVRPTDELVDEPLLQHASVPVVEPILPAWHPAVRTGRQHQRRRGQHATTMRGLTPRCIFCAVVFHHSLLQNSGNRGNDNNLLPPWYVCA